MATKLIEDIMKVDAMRTQLKDYFDSAIKPPQIRDWCKTLDMGLTFIQRAQSLKLAKLCGQITVDNRTVEDKAINGMLVIMETVFECHSKLRALNDSDEKECSMICSWFLENMDCIKERAIET